jgi:hypothetical protein
VATGLYLPCSDLNIVVNLKSRETEDCPKEALIYQFSDMISMQSSIISKWNIEKRGLLIVGRAELTKAFIPTRVEIIFKFGQTHLLHKNEDTMSKYLQTYPVVRPVYLILRQLFSYSGLVNPSTGGMNSLSFMTMMVALLQDYDWKMFVHTHNEALPLNAHRKSNTTIRVSVDTKESENRRISENIQQNSSQKISTGKFLMNFMYFYGFSFNYGEFSIAASLNSEILGSPFLEKESKKCSQLVIHSPHNKNMIITKSFKLTNQMTQCLKIIYNRLFQGCCCKILPGLRFEGLEAREIVFTPNIGTYQHVTGSDVKSQKQKTSLSQKRFQVIIKKVQIPELNDDSNSINDSSLILTDHKKLRRKKLSCKSMVYDAPTQPFQFPNVQLYDIADTYLIQSSLFVRPHLT